MNIYVYKGNKIKASCRREAITIFANTPNSTVLGAAEKYKKIVVINPSGKETKLREVDLKEVKKSHRMIETIFIDNKGKKIKLSLTTPWDFEGDRDKAFYFKFSDGKIMRLDDKHLDVIYKRLDDIIKANH